jgi:hypothetical protein
VRWAVVALAALLYAGTARAQPRAAVLEYRGTACAREQLVERVVSLGGEAFVESAATRVRVVVAEQATGIGATLAIEDGGRVLGERSVAAAGCVELHDALALIITMVLTRPAAPVEPPPREPPIPADIEVPPETGEVILTPIGYRALGASVTTTSRGAITISGRGELRRGAWSLGLGLAVTREASFAARGGDIAVQRAELLLAPCAHLGRFGGCAVVAAGLRSARGAGFMASDRAWSPYSAIGGRLLIDQHLRGVVGLRMYVEGRWELTSQRLRVDELVVWTSPRAEIGAGMGLVVRIP